MKLTDFISDVGRPIAYFPGLRSITGSTTATILLCQLIYWTGKEKTRDGWIYKNIAELVEETGMSEDEVIAARKKLVSAGLLEEVYARLEHRLEMRVNLENVNGKWGGIPEKQVWPNPKSSDGQTYKTGLAKPEKQVSLISNTYTTTENTTEITSLTDEQKKFLETTSIENQIAAGVDVIKIPMTTDEDTQKRDIAVMGICAGTNMHLEELAWTFMLIRKIYPTKAQYKFWRGALQEMYDQRVSEADIVEAIKKLSEKNFTISSPASISKTAIALAHPMERKDDGDTIKEALGDM